MNLNERLLKFGQDQDRRKAILVTDGILGRYKSFLQVFKLQPSRIQVFPLSTNGINLIFENENISLEIDIVDNHNLEYLLTNDKSFEKEESINFDRVELIFMYLHFLIPEKT